MTTIVLQVVQTDAVDAPHDPAICSRGSGSLDIGYRIADDIEGSWPGSIRAFLQDR